MLGWMRKQTRSWFVYIAFGIIIVVFVFFYGWRGGGSPDEAAVAIVNGESITRKQYDKGYENLLMLTRNLSENRTLTEEDIKQLRQKALDDIIERTLMLQEAGRLGMSVSLDETRKMIADTPAFQRDGMFDKDLYLRQLSANRMSPGDYEKAMQARSLISKLVDSVQSTAKLSDLELYELYRQENEKVNLAFIKIEASRYDSAVTVTQEDLEKCYEKNKEAYRIPEQVNVRHLPFYPKTYEATVQVTSEEVEQFYRLNTERFIQNKKVKARQILIVVDAMGGGEAEEKARKKAEDIKQKIDAGKDFAQLAQQFSQDAAAASKGGDLGYFEQGQMVKGFDEVAFSLKPGEVSPVVRTEKGFHIIKVEDVQEEKTQPLEAVRAVIEEELKQEKSDEVARREARRAVSQSYRSGNLVDYARENALKMKETGFFSPGEPIEGIGINKECSDAIFLLREAEITPVVSAEQGYHVFQLIERKASYLPPLEEVKAKIEKLARREKATAVAQGKSDGFLKDLSSGGTTMEEIAKREQFTIEETGFFARRSVFIGKIGAHEDLSRDAFALTKEKPSAQRVYSKGDNFFIVSLREKLEATRETFLAEKEKQRDAFMPLTRDDRVRIWLKALRARAGTEIFLTP